MIRAAITLLLCAATCRGAAAEPRTAYLLGCGGCHGIDGRSYAPRVPDLAGVAGYFLCTPDGRSYIARLPNVAYAHLSDAQLAEVMNYVTFTLGAGSAPPAAHPFTAGEMADARVHPLTDPAMGQRRAAALASVQRVCPGASRLQNYQG